MENASNSINQLVCTKCQQYLIKFPIYTTTDGTTCSECFDKKLLNGTRNVLFETLAKHLQFPCCNIANGCTIKLTPELLIEHQNHTCDFDLECPMNKSCKWTGTVPKFLQHAEAKHKCFPLRNNKLLFKYRKEIRNNTISYLILLMNQIFLIKINFVAENSVKLQLKVLTNTKDTFVCTLHPNLTGKVYFLQKDFETDMISELPDGSFEIIINEFKMNYTATTFDEFNGTISNLIRCRFCFDKISFYQCENDHLCCVDCFYKNKKKCMECDGDTFKLNKLIKNIGKALYHKCTNKGCDVIIQLGDKNHAYSCRFKKLKCPFQTCATEDTQYTFENLNKHFYNSHHDSVLDLNVLFIYLNFIEDTEVYAILKFNSVFLFKCSYKDENLMVGVELYVSNVNSNFAARIVIGENVKNNIVINLSVQKCDKQGAQNCINIPYSLLKPLLIDNLFINFNIDIVKTEVD